MMHSTFQGLMKDLCFLSLNAQSKAVPKISPITGARQVLKFLGRNFHLGHSTLRALLEGDDVLRQKYALHDWVWVDGSWLTHSEWLMDIDRDIYIYISDMMLMVGNTPK